MAATPGYFDLAQRIAAKKIPQVLILQSEDDVLTARLIRKIDQTIVSNDDMPDFNSNHFDGQNVDYTELVQAAHQLPFMARARFVLIRNAAEVLSAHGPNFIELAKTLPETTTLCLTARKFEKNTKTFRALKQFGVSFYQIGGFDRKSCERYIQALFNRHKKTIQRPTLEKLSERMANGNQEMVLEIEKLLLYVGDRNEITINDVETIISSQQEINIFALVDRIANKKIGEAMTIVETINTNSSNPFILTSLMRRHFRTLLRVKYYGRCNLPPSAIRSKIGVPIYFADQYMRQARIYSETQIGDIILSLNALSSLIKTSAAPQKLTIQAFILSLASCNRDLKHIFV